MRSVLVIKKMSYPKTTKRQTVNEHTFVPLVKSVWSMNVVHRTMIWMEKHHSIIDLFHLYLVLLCNKANTRWAPKKKESKSKSKEVIHISHIHTVAEYVMDLRRTNTSAHRLPKNWKLIWTIYIQNTWINENGKRTNVKN